MFITNNFTLFHLQWKENLASHQKVTKYFENDRRLYGYVYDISVDCDSNDAADILDIHKYLMVKNNIT